MSITVDSFGPKFFYKLSIPPDKHKTIVSLKTMLKIKLFTGFTDFRLPAICNMFKKK